jgi:uncharacterized phiE125 gp8 family phage protein
MHVTVITPAAAVVSWAEAQLHLRLDTTTDQTMVEAMIASITGWLSGPGGWLGRSVGSQTLEARFGSFTCSEVVLPCGPVTSISSIKYLDEDGVEQTLSASVYQRLTDGRVVLNLDEEWPDLYDDPEAVRVRYVAGDTPAAIKAAVLLMVGHLYANREAVVTGTIATALPLSVQGLLAPYRVFA